MIPTQTPSGWRTDQLSMPRPTCSVNSPVKEFEPRCLQNLCCCGKISIGVLLFYRLLDRYDILTRHPGIGSAYEEVKLPEVATLVPGVVGHCTDFIEHPDLVAERLVRYARLVGRENVLAGTDCGLGTRVGHPSICWAKFETMAEGARRATKILWGRA